MKYSVEVVLLWTYDSSIIIFHCLPGYPSHNELVLQKLKISSNEGLSHLKSKKWINLEQFFSNIGKTFQLFQNWNFYWQHLRANYSISNHRHNLLNVI